MVCKASAVSSPEPEVMAVGLPLTSTVTCELPRIAILPSADTDTSGVACSTSCALPLAARGVSATLWMVRSMSRIVVARLPVTVTVGAAGLSSPARAARGGAASPIARMQPARRSARAVPDVSVLFNPRLPMRAMAEIVARRGRG